MKTWGIYILAALGFVAYGAMTGADRDSSGAIVDAGTVDAFSMQVGDCFDDTDSNADEITSVPGVPCSEPHDNEAFAVFDVALPEYPNEEAMGELAYNACVERFAAFVGRDYESSSLEVTTMYPTQGSWAQDDREIVCAIYSMDMEKLVGSAEGRGL